MHFKYVKTFFKAWLQYRSIFSNKTTEQKNTFSFTRQQLIWTFYVCDFLFDICRVSILANTYRAGRSEFRLKFQNDSNCILIETAFGERIHELFFCFLKLDYFEYFFLPVWLFMLNFIFDEKIIVFNLFKINRLKLIKTLIVHPTLYHQPKLSAPANRRTTTKRSKQRKRNLQIPVYESAAVGRSFSDFSAGDDGDFRRICSTFGRIMLP